MNSERTFERSISTANLFAQLYTLGVVNDDEEIASVSFKNSVLGVDLKETPTTIVPMTIKVKKKEKRQSEN